MGLQRVGHNLATERQQERRLGQWGGSFLPSRVMRMGTWISEL